MVGLKWGHLDDEVDAHERHHARQEVGLDDADENLWQHNNLRHISHCSRQPRQFQVGTWNTSLGVMVVECNFAPGWPAAGTGSCPAP